MPTIERPGASLDHLNEFELTGRKVRTLHTGVLTIGHDMVKSIELPLPDCSVLFVPTEVIPPEEDCIFVQTFQELINKASKLDLSPACSLYIHEYSTHTAVKSDIPWSSQLLSNIFAVWGAMHIRAAGGYLTVGEREMPGYLLPTDGKEVRFE